MPVSNVVNPGADTCVVTFSQPHNNFSNEAKVFIRNVTGFTSVNGYWDYVVLNTTQIRITNNVPSSGAYSGGGTAWPGWCSPFESGSGRNLLSLSSSLPGSPGVPYNIHGYQHYTKIPAGCPVAPAALQGVDWWMFKMNFYGTLAWRPGVSTALLWIGGPNAQAPYTNPNPAGGDIASSVLLPYSPLVGKIIHICKGGGSSGIWEYNLTGWTQVASTLDNQWTPVYATEFIPEWNAYIVYAYADGGGSQVELKIWRYDPFTRTGVRMSDWETTINYAAVGQLLYDPDRQVIIRVVPCNNNNQSIFPYEWYEFETMNAAGPQYAATGWRTIGPINNGPASGLTDSNSATGPWLWYNRTFFDFGFLTNKAGGGGFGGPTQTWRMAFGDAPASTAPSITSINPTSGQQGQTITGFQINGQLFQAGASVSLGAGITVDQIVVSSQALITCRLQIAVGATVGARTVTVTNPDTQQGTLPNGFNVTSALINRRVPTSVGSVNLA